LENQDVWEMQSRYLQLSLNIKLIWDYRIGD